MSEPSQLDLLPPDQAADPAALANDISAILLGLLWSLPPACLAFLLAMVSFIRLLCLPRERKK